jgi:minor extracellular serine protease Vpr
VTARARRALIRTLGLGLCVAPAVIAAPAQAHAAAPGIEVIVRLAPPPLALVAPARRQLMGVGSVRRLDAASFGSRLYLTGLRRVQDAFAARLRAAVPAASVERRYGVVLDAVALRLPVVALARVERLPGVAGVYPVATYHADTNTVPELIGAVALWGAEHSTAGQGVKVGVIDDGIDAGAPFLRPAGLRAPAGFPRGQLRFTSGRVIVARSFAGRDAPNADHLAFDPNVSEHGTHVSGILAGASGTIARPGLGLPVVHGLSGVAPGAWLGNYRGLARGDHESGAIGSTVELAAAVDRAVADGMDVLNLSLGGPQIDPSADALSMALANAARAGVPSVVAAGNDFDSRGYGSISSPGTSETAITVAATSSTRVFGVSGRVGAGAPPALAPFTAVPSIGPRVTRRLTQPTPLVAAQTYGLDRRACREPSRRRPLRAVVIVLRGGCGFGTKAINAHEAGARAVIVESDRPGPPFVVEEQTDVPLLVVTDVVGRELLAYVARARAGARVRFTRTIAELPTQPRVLTDFSSAGPTPFDLLLKPDIAAPGEAILSSIPLASPDYPGAFAAWEGTSMAAPAVTGVVALIRERHPDWTPAQIRAALIGSAVPAYADSNGTVEASPLRTGGGFVDAPGAVAPGVLSDPPLLGFGLLRPGESVTLPVSLSDMGDGAGVWQVAIDRQGSSPAGAEALAPSEVTIPPAGAVLLPVTLTIAAGSPEGDAAGYVLLTQGTRTRHVPYWAHVERPRLAAARARLLRHPGIVRGTTRGQPDRVERYRYPAYTGALGLPVRWKGGEALYRFHLSKRAFNVGVTVESLGGAGLRPFLMRGGLDENRLAGESGLPIDVGPSLTDDPVPATGLYWAPPGDYAVAIDSARRRGGSFRLRFWVNDITPPALGRLRVSGDAKTLRIPVTDAGSGVDPRYLECALVQQGSSQDRPCRPDWDARKGIASISVGRLHAGLYALAVRAGDYAESRDALAIALSPQHVRTRVIGLRVDARGAIHVAPAPGAASFAARRQVDGG